MISTNMIHPRTAVLAIAAMMIAGDVQAGGASHHSTASAGHSLSAASHGSAAAVSSVGAVTAVPVLLSGELSTAAGAALQQIGAAAVSVAGETLDASSAPLPLGVYTTAPLLTPDAAPSLD